MTPRPNVMPKLASAIGMDALEFIAADPAKPSLEDMRLAAGLTMRETADAVGISERSYRGIEIGSTRRDPAPALVDSLARLFAVPAVTIRRAIDSARL